MVRLIVILIFGSLAGSCAGRIPEAPAPLLPDAGPWRLEARMAAIGRALAGQGFYRLDADRTGEVESEKNALLELRFASSTRLLLVLLGDEGRSHPLSLDLTVVTREGVMVAEDRAPNHRASLVFSARPGTVYVARVTAGQGSGRFLLSAFAAKGASQSVSLGALFDADPIDRRSFDSATQSARAMGFTPLPSVAKSAMRHGETLTLELPQERGRCYLFAVTSTPGVDIVEAHLESGGRMLARDLQALPEAWAQNCAEQSQTIQAVVTVRAGAGTVTAGWFDAAREAVLPLVGPPLNTTAKAPDIDAATLSAERRLASRGCVDIRAIAHATLNTGDRTATTLRLARGECKVVLAAVAGLEDVDVEVSRENQVILSDRATGSTPEVGFCADHDGDFAVHVIAVSGKGHLRVMAGQLPKVDLPVLPAPGTTYAAREAAARFKRAALAPVGEAQPLTGSADGGWATSLTLASHRCFGLAIVSSSSIAQVEVRASRGQTAAHWTGRARSALLTVCPAEDDTFAIKALTEHKEGAPAPYLLLFDSGPL
jgi:hypothetical protein